MRRYGGSLIAGLVATSLVACGWSLPARAQLAEDAAGTLSAAAATLQALHDGKLTRQFAAASFEAYREHSTAAAAEIRSLTPAGTVRQALDEAEAVLEAPCFDPGCDWEEQLESLRRSIRALLAAAAG